MSQQPQATRYHILAVIRDSENREEFIDRIAPFRGYKREELAEFINQLVADGYLVQEGDLLKRG